MAKVPNLEHDEPVFWPLVVTFILTGTLFVLVGTVFKPHDPYRLGQEQARIETLNNVNQLLDEEGWKIRFRYEDEVYRMVYPR